MTVNGGKVTTCGSSESEISKKIVLKVSLPNEFGGALNYLAVF